MAAAAIAVAGIRGAGRVVRLQRSIGLPPIGIQFGVGPACQCALDRWSCSEWLELAGAGRLLGCGSHQAIVEHETSCLSDWRLRAGCSLAASQLGSSGPN